jgi:hypothetical protein
MDMSQHEALHALITHGDVSPTNSTATEEESAKQLTPTPQGNPLTIAPQALLCEDNNYFTSPSVRRQRSNTAEGTLMPSPMPVSMPISAQGSASYPSVAGANNLPESDGFPELPTGSRYHGYFNEHAAAWAKQSSGSAQPMYPFNYYGYSLPGGNHFPSPPQAKTQHSSQGSSLDLQPQPMVGHNSSSFSTMSSGDTNPAEFHGTDNQTCDTKSMDGKLDDFFVSASS